VTHNIAADMVIGIDLSTYFWTRVKV